MAVPDFQSLILPTLKVLAGGAETPVSEIRNLVATAERLTEEDRREMLPSGRQTVLDNRFRWALSTLGYAGLTKRIRRGVWRLTEEGQQLLNDPPSRIDLKYLRNHCPAYVEWQAGKSALSSDDVSSTSPEDESVKTPEEAIEQALGELRGALEVEMLDRIREASPKFLERLVVDLLIAMGYGGGDATMGRVTGRPGDGGIDGIIQQDKLGLDEIYLQARRYAENQTVGRSALQQFVGAIDGTGATKGVFVTTANFTKGAKDYVEQSPKRIVLIDGKELARLMVAHDVGVVAHDIGVRGMMTCKVKRVDENYFDLEDL